MPPTRFLQGRDIISDLRRCRQVARPGHADGGPKAEEMLRELAFVLHLTRTVRDAITEGDELAYAR